MPTAHHDRMKKTLTAALALSAAATVASASAQGRLSAQSIIVNPVQTSLSVRVWTDRDSSGAGTPSYAPGEKIRLYTSVNQNAYVYLFNVDPDGQVNLILPNRYESGANYLRANAVKVFPAPGDPYTFDIAAPYGLNKVLALASLTPLNLNDFTSYSSQNNFADVSVQGQQGLAQALSIVVNPVPQNSWVSDTAYYQVAGRAGYGQPGYGQPGYGQPVYTPPVYTQPAPPVYVQPAPPVYVQPAPVQPAPVRPSPIQPAPYYPGQQTPWGNAREWRATVDARYGVRQVHDEYAARLQAEGLSLIRTASTRDGIRSDFRDARGQTARLEVERQGNRIEVTVRRDSNPRLR